MTKLKLFIITLLVLIVASFLFYGFYLGQKTNKKYSESDKAEKEYYSKVTTSNENTDWKLYKNIEPGYGLEFEHPANVEVSYYSNPRSYGTNYYTTFITNNIGYNVVTTIPPIGNVRSPTSIEEYIKSVNFLDIRDFDKITINNLNAYMSKTELKTYVFANGKVYEISAFYSKYYDNPPSIYYNDRNDNIYKHLLTTIKFIN